MAGVFNRLSSEVSGRTVTNESIVNVPNWLLLRCRVPGGRWFAPASCEVDEHHLELDLRRSVLTRQSRLVDPEGRVLSVTQRRFVSLRDPHLLVLESTWVPENFSGVLEVESALDGTVRNDGVSRYRELPDDHLEHVHAGSTADDTVLLHVRTNDSAIDIVQCARTRVTLGGSRSSPSVSPTSSTAGSPRRSRPGRRG